MIRSLEALRGIFVVMIFLVHYPLDGPATFVAGGDCGVAFFMMLSGFVMTAGYEKRLLSSKTGTLAFTGWRIAKIYPLHLLCFGLALALYDYVFDMEFFTKAAINLALMQSWVPAAVFSFNTVAWFLSDLLFFYLVFPVIVRRRLIHDRLAIALFFALTAVYAGMIPFIPADDVTYFCYIFPPARLIDFILGMLLRRLFVCLRDGRCGASLRRLSFAARTAAEAGAVAILIATIILYSHTPPCYRMAAMWWPAMAAVILIFSLTDSRPGAAGLLLRTKPLQVFGAASFVFFIFHRIGMSIVFRVLERLGISFSGVPLLLVNFAAVTVCAIIIHLYFQTLWNRKLHKMNI